MSESTGWYEVSCVSEEQANDLFAGIDTSDEEALERIGLSETWLDKALSGGDVTVRRDSTNAIRVFVELITDGFRSATIDASKTLGCTAAMLEWDSRSGDFGFTVVRNGKAQELYATSMDGQSDAMFFEHEHWKRFDRCKEAWQSGVFERDKGYQRAAQQWLQQTKKLKEGMAPLVTELFGEDGLKETGLSDVVAKASESTRAPKRSGCGTVTTVLLFCLIAAGYWGLAKVARQQKEDKRQETLTEVTLACHGLASCVERVAPAFDRCFDANHRWRRVGRRKREFELNLPGLRQCMEQAGVVFPAR